MKRIIFYWLPPFAYMGLIFFISSQSLEELQLPEIWNIDKVVHMVEYAILAVLWVRTLKTTGLDIKRVTIIAFSISFLYGISDEIHQYFVPNRNSSMFDAIADGIGVWLVVSIYKRMS